MSSGTRKSSGKGNANSAGSGGATADTYESLKKSIHKDLDGAEASVIQAKWLNARPLNAGNKQQEKTRPAPSNPSGTSGGCEELRDSLRSDWPLTDEQLARLANHLRNDIENFSLEFFNANNAEKITSPDRLDYLNLPEPLLTFMATMGASSEKDARKWVASIQNKSMRSRIMKKFVWKFLLQWVFGRFLWMGDLHGAAHRIARTIDPEAGECNDYEMKFVLLFQC